MIINTLTATKSQVSNTLASFGNVILSPAYLMMNLINLNKLCRNQYAGLPSVYYIININVTTFVVFTDRDTSALLRSPI